MYPIVQKNEFVTVTETFWAMSDGVELYTTITVPNGVEKCPTVFIRTPYDPATGGVPFPINGTEEKPFELTPFAKRGYAVVRQHVRGTGESKGVVRVYDERQDGLDSLEYIRKLPNYNGEIFLHGGSYTSAVHLSYLDAAGDDVKGAALSVMGSSKLLRNYMGGCCYDLAFATWWLGMLKRKYPNADKEQLYMRPYKDCMKRAIGYDVPENTTYLLHDDENDPFWKEYPQDYKPEGYKIPVLLMGGWWDWQHTSMLETWCRMPEQTRKLSAYCIGPWGHSCKLPKEQEYAFPPEAERPDGFSTDWFDSIREGRPYKYAKTNCLTYWSVGDEGWRSTAYPLPGKDALRLHFGLKELVSAPAQGSITYTYDPENYSDTFKWKNIKVADAPNSVEDVVSFVSAPFEETQNFCGEHRFSVEVSSDCEDTGFFFRIYMVENGTAYNLTEVVTALRHVHPDYVPGTRVTLDLKTPLMAFTIQKGAQVRIDMASHSNIYNPPANVKGHWAEVTETKVAHNTLHLEHSFAELIKE